MSRNNETRFSNLPNVSIGRSKFKRNSSHKTSFNVGELIPFYVDSDVLPGDTRKITTSMLTRLQSLITPVMDNIYMDTYWFFVPYRLLWEHSKQFFGENTSSKWIPSVEYTIPQIAAPGAHNVGENTVYGWDAGTIADYMGIKPGVGNLKVSSLPFRAYAMICNEFFRDQNNQDPLNIPVTDSEQTGSNGSSYVNDVANGGKPFIACKFHDYFTSALPDPQKGDAVQISLGNITGAVYGTGKTLALTDGNNISGSYVHGNVFKPYPIQGFAKNIGDDVVSGNSLTDDKFIGLATKEQIDAISGSTPDDTGLVADIYGGALVTINELRSAFQLQKMLERDARGGTRYIEILKSHFGVTSPDSRLQRPEYLGGTRYQLNINQVVQTSQTDDTPQGNTAAYSLTTNINKDFTHSFVEHGILMGLCVARYDHTYQDGIERQWFRKTKLDFYWPVFANIGEQAIKNREIYVQGSNVVNPDTNKAYDDEVFGYQEAWAEYRYKPNRVSGEMRSNYAQSLDSWHLADDYDSLPVLSSSWIQENSDNVDRIIAVSKRVSNQIFADIYVQDTAIRPMPVYSVPGLMDHN